MFPQALAEVRGAAGVIGTVGAFEDINSIGHEIRRERSEPSCAQAQEASAVEGRVSG